MNQPGCVCAGCGNRYGRLGLPNNRMATWHMNHCDVCGEWRAVTEPRDFGYLRPEWEQEKHERTR